MAQVKASPGGAREQSSILERGDIYFLYRPRVGVDEAHGIEDVQRFYILLKPRGRREYRLLIVGRKKLPDPGEHDRFWAFVDRAEWTFFRQQGQLPTTRNAMQSTGAISTPVSAWLRASSNSARTVKPSAIGVAWRGSKMARSSPRY